jgi:hypothetical protein
MTKFSDLIEGYTREDFSSAASEIEQMLEDMLGNDTEMKVTMLGYLTGKLGFLSKYSMELTMGMVFHSYEASKKTYDEIEGLTDDEVETLLKKRLAKK